MSRKLLLSSMAVLLLQGGIAFADPGGREEKPVEREKGQAGRTWVWSLGEKSAELVVAAPDGFDPGGMEVDFNGTVRMEKTGRKLTMYVDRPDWARELIVAGAMEPLQLAAGETGRLPLQAGVEPVRVAVDLLKADSAVEVVVLGHEGEVLKSLTATSSVPVRWSADLGTVDGGVRVELRVLRGRAAGGVIGVEGNGLRPITAAAIVGSAQFNRTINYSGSPDLYYTVTGGPPNTCGELNSYRNGSWIYAGNWLCTNGSGNATKGPWTYAGTPSNQTDEPAYIRWPNGDTTNNALHIWDKNCSQTFKSSAGVPPSSYSGYATDAQWGAGFDFYPSPSSVFEDETANLYWDPATGDYTSASYKAVSATLSRVNRWRVNWTTVYPSPGDHVSGHQYYWYTCVDDGQCGQCATLRFTAP